MLPGLEATTRWVHNSLAGPGSLPTLPRFQDAPRGLSKAVTKFLVDAAKAIRQPAVYFTATRPKNSVNEHARRRACATLLRHVHGIAVGDRAPRENPFVWRRAPCRAVERQLRCLRVWRQF